MKKNTSLKNQFLISLIVISLILLFLDRFGFLNGLKSAYESLTSPIQKSITNINRQILSFNESISNISSYKDKLDKLEEEVITFREKQLDVDKLSKENEVLRNQLNLKLNPEEILIEANVINFSNLYSPDYLSVDIGENMGIKKGDIVVYGKYAVGIVSEVRSNTSDVEIINSKTTNIAVENISGSAKGVLKKDIKNRLLMTLVLPEEQIVEGEQVITSGLNSPFPYGLLIGKVITITKSSNNFNREAEVEKYLDFVKLHKVFVIKKS